MRNRACNHTAALAAVGVSLLGASAALAHPHVWIKVRTELIVTGGALTGLRHTWVFDESWLTSQLEEHDKDKDGRLTPAELAPLAVESRQTLDTFKSFTVVRAGGSLVRAVKPRDVSIDYHGALLGMTFNVSLAKPLPLKGEMLLEVYDAGYFSSFSFDGAGAVAFTGAAPEGCSIKVGVPPSPQQMRDYRQMLKEIGPELSKPFTPQSVSISCAATPVARGPADAPTASVSGGSGSGVVGPARGAASTTTGSIAGSAAGGPAHPLPMPSGSNAKNR